MNNPKVYITGAPADVKEFTLDDVDYRSHRIEIREKITREVALDVTRQIRTMNDLAGDEPITLLIDSAGGDVSSDMMIIDAMYASDAPVNTVVLGTAESMAAVIAAAGRYRQIMPHASIYLHSPTMPINTPAATAEELEFGAKRLNNVRDKIAEILAVLANKEQAEILKMMQEGTRLSALDAITAGLADSMVAPPRKQVEQEAS